MARVYDLKRVICTVSGVNVGGYGESDALSFEWSEEITSRKSTADGQIVHSRNNNRECIVTITLMQTSRAIPLLLGLLETQHGDNLGIAPPVVVPMAFQMLDPSTGDELAGTAIFVNRPAPSKSKDVGEVEFMLSIDSPRYVLGAANLLSVP